MTSYILRRLVAMVPVILLVTIVTFGLMRVLPGDPAVAMIGLEADPSLRQLVRQEMGLDKPLYLQYTDWLGRSLHGDFGIAYRTRSPVGPMILSRLPVTLELGVLGMLIAACISLPVGILSAIRPNSKLDIFGTVFAVTGVAVPNFWLGLLMILLFAQILGWLPPFGYVPLLNNFGENLRSMVLPAAALGMAEAAVLTRMTRSSLVEVLRQEYVTAARSKGLAERAVILRHALKNSLIPVVTILGLQISRLIGGAVILETVFALPGIGRLAVDSILYREFMVVQGVVLLMALAVVFSNLFIDILYGYLDPRIRYS